MLAEGAHLGFEWAVTHNGMGYRCGYVRIPKGHPWHGKDYDDIAADVHGGLTFAEADMPCDKGAPDDAWWLGFDCGHGGDAPDPSLPCERFDATTRQLLAKSFAGFPRTIRTQEYVEAQCRSLCEQTKEAQ